jgi:hypothetical protein
MNLLDAIEAIEKEKRNAVCNSTRVWQSVCNCIC